MEESTTEPIRKLASIRKISNLLPIKGKDFIELAQVDGWQVIVKKEEFKVNDLCVFFEIDSFLPVERRYEFLGKTKEYKGTYGYRLKTMKMAGALSQGLALPLSLYPELENPKLNDNVTQQLNITKYDVAILTKSSPVTGNQAGSFPSFLPKTDQERIQNLMSYFTTHKDTVFEETLKLDGSSCTIYSKKYIPTLWDKLKSYFGFSYKKSYIGVCSRNIELKKPTNDTKSQFWDMVYKYKIDKSLPEGYAIQGELIAPNIQSNHEKVKEPQLYIFDIYNFIEQRYLTSSERTSFMAAYIPYALHVPIINRIQIFKECPTIEQLLKRVEGPSLNPNTTSEGRVYKSITSPDITFKVINNKYLLKEK